MSERDALRGTPEGTIEGPSDEFARAPEEVGDVLALTLFSMEEQKVSLADKFGFPPMSVLDRRTGPWQARGKAWKRLGIQSELGRTDRGSLTFNRHNQDDDFGRKLKAISGGTSLFDPVICELAYRWFCPPAGRVLDPFSGGSVRGVVASVLGREYLGIDVRPEQIDANYTQTPICGVPNPTWVCGDALDLEAILDREDKFDLLFSCPPYADLEVYSDDPRDLSTMPYDQFLSVYRQIIATSVARLRQDRFAVWVVSEIRNKKHPAGAYRGFVPDTIRAFEDAGMFLYNEAIIVDPLGTAQLRAEGQMGLTRKLTKCHQNVLIFLKGDPRVAARAIDGEEAYEARRARRVSRENRRPVPEEN